MGYRKVRFLEQLLYIIEAALERRWKWITGECKQQRELKQIKERK
jgi:hypothetical protein